LVFVPAEVVAKLVEVREADFVAKVARIAIGVLPEVFEIE
jgi:hypothetical protein